jgi:hypothetical protein
MFLPGEPLTVGTGSLKFEQNSKGRDPLAISYTVFRREADNALSPQGLAAIGAHPSTALLGIFYALQIIGGQIGFPLVLFMIAIRRTTLPGIQHAVFLNFYMTWVISSFSFCLLLVYSSLGEQPLSASLH